jgi:hypothetical protein
MAGHRPLTVETDPRSGGASWVIAGVLVVAVMVAVVFFSGMSGSETARNNAGTEAANSVGSAAKNVGDAAQDAVRK